MVIITDKEMKIINKKLSNKKLSQVERNRLSRSIRPKLKEIANIDSINLLKKMEYNQKAISIEKTITKVIKENLPELDSIILYGSAIWNNYHDYNDIDIMIVTKKKLYEGLMSKWKKVEELKNIFQKEEINADIQIYGKNDVEYGLMHSPTLIYELNDCKIIYGSLKIPNKKRVIYNIDLRMKLSYSDIEDTYLNGNELYKALRNIIAVRLILNKIVDNKKLIESLNEEIGKALIKRLKNNCESKTDRKIALFYLRELLAKTREEIRGDLWEKTEL